MDATAVRSKYSNGKYKDSQIAQSLRCYYAKQEEYKRKCVLYKLRINKSHPRPKSIVKYNLKYDETLGWY